MPMVQIDNNEAPSTYYTVDPFELQRNIKELQCMVDTLTTTVGNLVGMFENIRIEADRAGLLKEQIHLSEMLKSDTESS